MLEHNYKEALNDFNQARMKASLQEVLARLTGKSNELLSYEEVEHKLKLSSRTERGVYEIPIKAIVGSVGRYTDFTRSFMPKRDNVQDRWVSVKAAIDSPAGTGLPPIDVYKVGEVYFVLDGNHRVSVARQEGFEFIEARVVEVQTNVPLTPDIQPDDLIIKAEYAEFLRDTNFAELRPNVDLSVTAPGQYEKLKDHIHVHQYFMGIDEKRDIPFAEAVTHWYDAVYLAIVEPIRERGLLRWFPDRTETDLYLWVSEHRAALEDELGWNVTPEAAASHLVTTENPQATGDETTPGAWRISKMVDRYTDRLFKEILVPLNGSSESWNALEQAIIVAKKEDAILRGLYVVPPKRKLKKTELAAIQHQFTGRCESANLSGSLYLDEGDISARICERALLTDMITLNVAHPPEGGLSSLNSGLRTIIHHSARPILTVSNSVSRLERALVAFDGSPKSKEALFVAAYIAEQWKTHLSILTVLDGNKVTPSVQEFAHTYLNLHEVRADYMVEENSPALMQDVLAKQQVDLVILGGYRGNPWQEIFVDSMVNSLLREAYCPLLICR